MYSREEKVFISISVLLSVLHAVGYVFLGHRESFNICVYSMILLDLLYIPATVIKSKRLFPFYLVLFSVALVFITSYTNSKLYNNYSALLCLFVGVLIKPKYKNVFMALYLITTVIAFCITGEPAYYLLIHSSRALWIFVIYDFIVYQMYNRKPVILFDEEKEILEQLSNNMLQKEIELNGLSERTIRRRLDAAKKRNGLKTTEELKELYINSYKKAK